MSGTQVIHVQLVCELSSLLEDVKIVIYLG